MWNNRTNSVLFRIQKIFAVLAALGLVSILGLYLYLSSLDGMKAKPLVLEGTTQEGPLFFAHRGGLREAPENTIAAFEKAARSGVDVLELDIHATANGSLVVHHDASLKRTTGSEGLVAEADLETIKALDAGYTYSNDGGKSYPYRGKGVEIPTLREVFERFDGKPMNIEIKSTDESVVLPLCGLISEFGRKKSVIVASTGSEVLARFRKDCEGVATSASFRETLWFLFLYKTGFSGNFDADMQALQVPERMFGIDVITKDFLGAARERNLKIHIWTANKKSDIKRLVDAGVDGVMTDRPSLIREVLGN